MIFFLLCFVGGCSGSTSGGIKVFRWQIFIVGLRRLAIHNFAPNRIIPLFYSGRRVVRKPCSRSSASSCSSSLSSA